jgi:chromate transporter
MNKTPPQLTENDVQPVSLRESFWFWLKLGFISFGGPAGQISIMHKSWLNVVVGSPKRFLHALNYCMLLPGPEAQQLATYIGWLMHRTWGGSWQGTVCTAISIHLDHAVMALHCIW